MKTQASATILTVLSPSVLKPALCLSACWNLLLPRDGPCVGEGMEWLLVNAFNSVVAVLFS